MAIHPLDSYPLSSPEHKKPTRALAENVSNDQTASPALASQTNPKDTLNLTNERADYEVIQEKIAQLPDVRQERIQEIQEALKSGQYHVSSEDLADRLIQDTIKNKTRQQP